MGSWAAQTHCIDFQHFVWSHLVVEVGEEHEEGDHVGNARVLWDGDWGNSNYEEDYRTILFFGNNLQENGDDMDESDSWSNLHPHWEVAPNPYGIEAHHKGGDELDHLTVYVAWTWLWMCGLVQMWYMVIQMLTIRAKVTGD